MSAVGEPHGSDRLGLQCAVQCYSRHRGKLYAAVVTSHITRLNCAFASQSVCPSVRHKRASPNLKTKKKRGKNKIVGTFGHSVYAGTGNGL